MPEGNNRSGRSRITQKIRWNFKIIWVAHRKIKMKSRKEIVSHWDLYKMDCDFCQTQPSLLEFLWIELKYYLGWGN